MYFFVEILDESKKQNRNHFTPDSIKFNQKIKVTKHRKEMRKPLKNPHTMKKQKKKIVYKLIKKKMNE